MTAKEVIKRLKAEGWEEREGRRHQNFSHPEKPESLVSVPRHKGDLPIGTLRNIDRQAGWDWRDR